jgi:hypothetical protein
MSPPGNYCLQSHGYCDGAARETYEIKPIFPPRVLTADLIHTKDALLFVLSIAAEFRNRSTHRHQS